MNIILIHFAIKYKGDWDKIYAAIENKEKVSITEMKTIEDMIKKSQWKVITLIDQEYPKWLKNAYKPPFVFWYQGDIKKLDEKFICATGNQVDEIAEKRVEKFMPEIEKGHLLVTGDYPGIDKKIITQCKKSKLFILAQGFNEKLNVKFNDKDLILSEYPPETKPHRDHYKNRNRLIAAFASSLVLFTSLKNGPINDLITNFLNLGKDVYAFPGNGDENDGNSELIKQGATLITTIKDISC